MSLGTQKYFYIGGPNSWEVLLRDFTLILPGCSTSVYVFFCICIKEFEQDKCNWFPRTDTREHKAYDKRTPGLFKVKWEGQGIVGLCSKTYLLNMCFEYQVNNKSRIP